MEENQVQETGMERLNRLRKEAATFGIKGVFTADEFEKMIAEKKAGGQVTEKTPETASPATIESGLTDDEAAKIDSEMRYRFFLCRLPSRVANASRRWRSLGLIG